MGRCCLLDVLRQPLAQAGALLFQRSALLNVTDGAQDATERTIRRTATQRITLAKPDLGFRMTLPYAAQNS